MRRSSSMLLLGGLAALSMVALAACVEGTSSSATASAPTDAATTPTPPATTPKAATPPPPPATTPVATVTATPAIPSAPTTALPSPTTAPTVAAAPAGLLGTWESASCGARTYPRRITFADATTFTAEDRVSPCPKGTTCIWSGIVNHEGTYRIEKDSIALTVSRPSSGPHKVEFPASLTLDASRAPVEAGSDGKACPYKHAGDTRKL